MSPEGEAQDGKGEGISHSCQTCLPAMFRRRTDLNTGPNSRNADHCCAAIATVRCRFFVFISRCKHVSFVLYVARIEENSITDEK